MAPLDPGDQPVQRLEGSGGAPASLGGIGFLVLDPYTSEGGDHFAGRFHVRERSPEDFYLGLMQLLRLLRHRVLNKNHAIVMFNATTKRR